MPRRRRAVSRDPALCAGCGALREGWEYDLGGGRTSAYCLGCRVLLEGRGAAEGAREIARRADERLRRLRKRERQRFTAAAWRDRNRDWYRERSRRSYQRRRDRILAKAREYRRKPDVRERTRVYNQAYRQAHPGLMNALAYASWLRRVATPEGRAALNEKARARHAAKADDRNAKRRARRAERRATAGIVCRRCGGPITRRNAKFYCSVGCAEAARQP